MTFEGDPSHEPSLTRDDAQAMEALFAAGLDPAKVDPRDRDRARRVLLLIEAMDSSPGERARDRQLLIDATFARAMRAGGRTMGPGSRRPMTLMQADADAADALEIAGYDPLRVPAALAERAERLNAFAAMIRSGVAAGATPRRMVDTVMARIASAEAARSERMKLEPARGFSILAAASRWRDVASVAAVLMVATSVAWTMMGAVSHYKARASCASGLGSVASAMTQYAGDFRDELPIATASLAGGKWWDVRRDQAVANSANLYTLPRTGYTTPAALACVGNPSACRSSTCEPGAMDWSKFEEISYSYQIMFGQFRPRWQESSKHVVLADRSPAVLRAVRGEMIRPEENSRNHTGAGSGLGQNVLFNDGAAAWLSSPVTDTGDNIWLPKAPSFQFEVIQTPTGIGIQGRELPRDLDDAFVGP